MSAKRAVLDPGDLKSAFVSSGSVAERLLVAWTEGAYELVVSPKLLGELEQELVKPQMRRHFPASRAKGFIMQLASKGIYLEDPEPDAAAGSKPGGSYLVTLAGASGADWLVSSNPYLMELKDASPPVISPAEFLQQLTAGG